MFSFFAIYDIPEEKYLGLLEGVAEKREKDAEEQEFALEKYLEDFIVTNFSSIFGGNLELYTDPEGNIGQQYPTEIGTIDILAKEPSTSSFVVIEFKKGRESDRVVGQILRYMGWVKENICQGREEVKGLIICKDRDEQLDYALKMTQNIEVKHYIINFELTD